MEIGGIMGGLYRLCDWAYRLAYVNILWILFTLLGGVVLGVFPATAGLFAVLRQWLQGNDGILTFSYFWGTYRHEFWRVNGLGWLLLSVAVLWLIDFRFFAQMDGLFGMLMKTVFLSLLSIFLIVCLHIFPVYVHFQRNLIQYLKYSAILGISFLHYSVLALTLSALILFLLFHFPGFLPFYGVSLPALAISGFSHRIFTKVENQGDVGGEDSGDSS